MILQTVRLFGAPCRLLRGSQLLTQFVVRCMRSQGLEVVVVSMHASLQKIRET
jgi:hypothetical protein